MFKKETLLLYKHKILNWWGGGGYILSEIPLCVMSIWNFTVLFILAYKSMFQIFPNSLSHALKTKSLAIFCKKHHCRSLLYAKKILDASKTLVF